MNIHVIIGEDDFLVEEAAKKIVGDGVGLEVVDSLNSTNEELRLKDIRLAAESFATPSMFDPKKVTWWKNVGFLPGAAKERGASEAVAEALKKFAKTLVASPLPENQHFILSGPRLLATSEVAKTLKTGAEMLVFSAGKPWEAAKNAVVRVIDDAKELGLSFEPGAADAFVARVGTDARSLRSELAKMREYLGSDSAKITVRAIAEITSEGVGVEAVPWDVTDAIGNRDAAKALAALKRFELENGFAVMMTTVLERFFRTLVEFKDAKTRGEMKFVTEGVSPYAVRKNEGFVARWTLNELRAAHARFMRLRERAVDSTDGVEHLVVAEVVRAIGSPGRIRRSK